MEINYDNYDEDEEEYMEINLLYKEQIIEYLQEKQLLSYEIIAKYI